jgi:putative lipoic acid-binding regulatory protein
MSDGPESLLRFPCEFPIKVMGRESEAFRSLTLAIVERHAGPLPPARISQRQSARGNFLALTYTIEARDQAQLDAIYRELTSSGLVLVAL